jgi:hypothetical protein
VGQAQHGMLQVKDTLRATVQLSFDGRVIKTYHGADALGRFHQEVRVLRHLEARGCGFVPLLLEAHPAEPRIITTTVAPGWSIWMRNGRESCSQNSKATVCGTTTPTFAM